MFRSKAEKSGLIYLGQFSSLSLFKLLPAYVSASIYNKIYLSYLSFIWLNVMD